MSEQPDLSTLPQRMREAASVLAEATEWSCKNAGKLRNGVDLWCEQDLLEFADRYEAQHRAASERVEKLAQEIYFGHRQYKPHAPAWADCDDDRKRHTRALAAHLIESGWRKGDPE